MTTISRKRSILETRIDGRTISLALFAVMLLSRASVTTNIDYVPIDTTLFQLSYSLMMLTMYLLGLYKNKQQFVNRSFHWSTLVSGLLVLYIVLFGCLFTNPPLETYTRGMLMRQGLFLGVIISSVAALYIWKAQEQVPKVSFWVMSFILIVQFVTNISDVSLIAPSSIFSVAERVRASFGFSHYNALGGFCVCHLILAHMIYGNKSSGQRLGFCGMFFIAVSVLMLLGSASRNAITGLVLYGLICWFERLNASRENSDLAMIIKVVIVGVIVFFVVAGSSVLPIDSLLVDSNRFTLFSVALPTFFSSGRLLFGLGLASSEIYGANLTPYVTYWLDNSYIFALVTTGFVGLIIVVATALILLAGVKRVTTGKSRAVYLGIYGVVLYSALFETSLFWAGVYQNYVYMTLLLLVLTGSNSSREQRTKRFP